MATGLSEGHDVEDIARTGLEPRVRNLQTRTIPLAGGGAVSSVRVPTSYAIRFMINKGVDAVFA